MQEAAQRLGVTPDAIRSRLRRGTLEGGKDGDTWYVVLPSSEDDGDRQDDDTPRHDTDATPAALIEQLQGEVSYLRSELTAAREQAAKERERADVIQREALDRIQGLIPIATGPTVDRQDAPESTVRPDRDDQGANTGQQHRDGSNGIWQRLGRWLRGEGT